MKWRFSGKTVRRGGITIDLRYSRAQISLKVYLLRNWRKIDMFEWLFEWSMLFFAR